MAEELPVNNIEGSIIDNLTKSEALKNYEIVKEPDKFLEDKACHICKAEFGIIGIVHAKKCMCKFCGRGVCPKCSPERLQHPESNKEQRICFVCLKRIMGKHMSLSYNERVNELEEEKGLRKLELECMIKEKQMDMSYNQYLDELIKTEMGLSMARLRAKEDEIEKMIRGQEGMMKKFVEVQDEYKKFKEYCDKKKSIEENLSSNLESLVKVHENNKFVLPGLRNRVGELQEIEISLKSRLREKQELAKSLTLSDKEQKVANEYGELQHQNFIFEEENRIFSAEIWKLVKENNDLDEKILSENLITEPKSDSLIISAGSKYSQEEEIRISELNKKSKENQKIIRDLRMRLESQNILLKKSKLNTDHKTPEPGSRPCANCLIY